mgnify:CR=1 FL=1|jgi:hypothetical protein
MNVLFWPSIINIKIVPTPITSKITSVLNMNHHPKYIVYNTNLTKYQFLFKKYHYDVKLYLIPSYISKNDVRDFHQAL